MDLLEALKLTHEAFCGARCPSQWVTKDHPEGQPHIDACKEITELIAKTEKREKAKKGKWSFTGFIWSWKWKETGEVEWDRFSLADTKKEAVKLCGKDQSVVRVRLDISEI